MIDYLDEDVGYFLGMLVARGTISESSGTKRVVIEFPFKNLRVVGIRKKIVQKDKLLLSIMAVRSRIDELSDFNIRPVENEYSVSITFESLKNTVFWRDLKLFMGAGDSYLNFLIPEQIFEADTSIKKEFVRGFADVAGSARKANNYMGRVMRVYLDVLNQNWKLVPQLCHLIQDHLNVPIHSVAYGHPNIRDPEVIEYNAGRREAWAREHQIKILADEFLKIGFYMKHKQEILEELAEHNRSLNFQANFCNPPKEIKKRKDGHPGESSEKLPTEIRGKHYDSYWQICADLGCYRYRRYREAQTTLDQTGVE
ncbi:MAG: hypothetical protein ABC611_08140 [Candidatus Methanosuratincola petrocarbonis]